MVMEQRSSTWIWEGLSSSSWLRRGAFAYHPVHWSTEHSLTPLGQVPRSIPCVDWRRVALYLMILVLLAVYLCTEYLSRRLPGSHRLSIRGHPEPNPAIPSAMIGRGYQVYSCQQPMAPPAFQGDEDFLPPSSITSGRLLKQLEQGWTTRSFNHLDSHA